MGKTKGLPVKSLPVNIKYMDTNLHGLRNIAFSWIRKLINPILEQNKITRSSFMSHIGGDLCI